MTNKFERQLQQLLSSDVEKEIDNLPEDEENEVIEELTPVVFEEKESNLAITDNPDLQEDYKFARSNYYGLIGRTNSAIDLALKIAAMSEHPRAMEVAANLMKTSSEITKDLIALQKSISSSENKQKDLPNGNFQQNNYYYNAPKDAIKDIDSKLDELDDQDI